jgi:predicted RNase H-like HicB family nuclease
MTQARYHINIFYSDEDGGFIADVPDLAGCSAFGKTSERALAEVNVAMKNWLAAARKLKRAIPKPRYRPAIYQMAP